MIPRRPLVLIALLALGGCAKGPDAYPEVQPGEAAHNFGYEARLRRVAEDRWMVDLTCPPDLGGGWGGSWTGALDGEAIPVAVAGGALRGLRATWTFDRARWREGTSFRLRLHGPVHLLLEVRLGPEPGRAEGLRVDFLERRAD